MKKVESMDEYIRGVLSYARQFEYAQQKKTSEFFYDLADYLKSLPTVEAKPVEWIPCSERLPEDCEKVLVWFEYFRYGDYNRLYQTIGISYTWNGKWSGFVDGQSGWHKLRIIAWQPLPAPYNADMRGGKNE